MIKGKALDISQLTPMDGYDSSIIGSSNPEDMKDSDVKLINQMLELIGVGLKGSIDSCAIRCVEL